MSLVITEYQDIEIIGAHLIITPSIKLLRFVPLKQFPETRDAAELVERGFKISTRSRMEDSSLKSI